MPTESSAPPATVTHVCPKANMLEMRSIDMDGVPAPDPITLLSRGTERVAVVPLGNLAVRGVHEAALGDAMGPGGHSACLADMPVVVARNGHESVGGRRVS